MTELTSAFIFLPYSIVAHFADERRTKAQQNMVFGDAPLHQVGGNIVLGGIFKNPDFVVANVQMDGAVMHSALMVPT